MMPSRGFFVLICTYYGLPLHIMRDLYLTRKLNIRQRKLADEAEAEPTYIAPHAHKSQVKYPPDQTKIAKSSVLKQRLQVLTLPLP